LTEVFLNLTKVFLTLTEVFPCFFLSCKANARWKLAKTGHGPHSSTLVCICVVRFLFVLFYVLFVCKCVLPPGDNPIAVNEIYHNIFTLYFLHTGHQYWHIAFPLNMSLLSSNLTLYFIPKQIRTQCACQIFNVPFRIKVVYASSCMCLNVLRLKQGVVKWEPVERIR